MSPTPDRDRAHDDIDALLTRLRTAASEVFGGTAVFLAYVYGSRIWGTATERSDVDVGYYLSRSAGADCLALSDELRLAGLLSDIVQVEVDLRCLARAPLSLRGRVLEDGQRIHCSDEVARVNLERDLLGEYHDYKTELEALRRLRLAAMAARSR